MSSVVVVEVFRMKKKKEHTKRVLKACIDF